jgi:hypothetical protein
MCLQPVRRRGRIVTPHLPQEYLAIHRAAIRAIEERRIATSLVVSLTRRFGRVCNSFWRDGSVGPMNSSPPLLSNRRN